MTRHHHHSETETFKLFSYIALGMVFYLWPVALPGLARDIVLPIWLIIAIVLTILYASARNLPAKHHKR